MTLKFDHELLRLWRQHVPAHSAVILAVSGGVDSMVMADFLWRWQRLLKLELVIAHVHHGKKRGAQGRFRDQALHFVHAFACERQLPFWTNVKINKKSQMVVEGPKKTLKSELDLRQFRWKWLRKWQEQWQKTYDRQVFICTAHTADDLIETQLIRLLRGTGPEGLKAMSVRDRDVLRPLLRTAKVKILAAAKKQRLSWVEDPSNLQTDVLRNWLRQHWLAPLQKRWPEATGNMARSFSHLIRHAEAPGLVVHAEGLKRQDLMALAPRERAQSVIQYFRQQGIFDYTQGHVEEVLKRLDTGRRDLTFKLLGRRCVMTAEWIVLRPDST